MQGCSRKEDPELVPRTWPRLFLTSVKQLAKDTERGTFNLAGRGANGLCGITEAKTRLCFRTAGSGQVWPTLVRIEFAKGGRGHWLRKVKATAIWAELFSDEWKGFQQVHVLSWPRPWELKGTQKKEIWTSANAAASWTT